MIPVLLLILAGMVSGIIFGTLAHLVGKKSTGIYKLYN